MKSINRIKAIKIGGCINVGSFAIVKDTSEDATVVDIMGDGCSDLVRGAANTIDMVVLKMFGKKVEGESVVSKSGAGSMLVLDVG